MRASCPRRRGAIAVLALLVACIAAALLLRDDGAEPRALPERIVAPSRDSVEPAASHDAAPPLRTEVLPNVANLLPPAAPVPDEAAPAADPLEDGGDFRVLVLDEDTRPIDGAHVWVAAPQAGSAGAWSDARGEARLPRAIVVPGARVVVHQQERAPVDLELGADVAEPLTIVLRRDARIAGIVRTAGGTPCASWRVELVDGAVVPHGSDPMSMLSSFIDVSKPLFAESIAGNQRDGAQSDREGRFELRGLRPDRSYRLLAYHEPSLRRFESAPIRAGASGVEVVVPDVAGRPLVDGAVVDVLGAPLAGVVVRLGMVLGETGGVTRMCIGQETLTGGDGAFAFRDVPYAADVWLQFDGENLEDASLALPPEHAGRHLRVVLSGPLCFTVAPQRAECAADTLAVENAGGVRLSMHVDLRSGAVEVDEWPLDHGESLRVTVPDVAAWIVLGRRGRPEQRIAVPRLRGECSAITYGCAGDG